MKSSSHMLVTCLLLSGLVSALGQEPNADPLAFPDTTHAPRSDKVSLPAGPQTGSGDLEMPSLTPSAANPIAPQEEAKHPDVQRGYMAMQKEQLDVAIKFFLKGLEEIPGDKSALFGLGTAYIKQNKHREALEILAPLYERFPQDYHIINNLAWIYASTDTVILRDGQRAIKLAQEALLIRPDDHHVWSTLAEAHYISGNYEKAMRASRLAIELAQKSNLERARLQEYLVQFNKCRQAVAALSLLD